MADMLHRIEIKALPERVFEAITTTEGLRSWWTRDANAVPEKGSTAILRFAEGKVVFRMRVDELTPARRVAWRCVGDEDEWTGTLLTWDLALSGDGDTVLQFAHRGWDRIDRAYPLCNATWGHLLYLLRDHAEGRPVTPQFPG